MTTNTFTLTNDNEFITLDTLMKLMRLASSGGEAHAMILDGMVIVNGEVELQKRKKIRVGDVVEFTDQRIEVTA